jgi:hypothetical protein
MSTEQRLRDAFNALADTVDTEEAPPRRVRQRRPIPILAAAVVLLGAVGIAVILQRQADPTQPAIVPYTTSLPTTSTPSPFAFDLYTHCGIDEAKIGEAFFEAEKPIQDPADGFDNPYQKGTMTLQSPSRAVFKDDKGHVVYFRVRPGATEFKRICK